jgi:hypothetical protein
MQDTRRKNRVFLTISPIARNDTAQSPLPLKPGQELWIEVTVPPKGRRAPAVGA